MGQIDIKELLEYGNKHYHLGLDYELLFETEKEDD